jgi:GDP/UDP-N,N'-diacetylbacillosamine 2-epimerase (hydrolysing)
MARRRILAVLESRATYGYAKNVMLAMQSFPELELQTLVTGAHLIHELGHSVDLIKEDGFPITIEVPLAPSDERSGAWSRALGQGITGFADAFEQLQPDIVLLSGDRIETTGCCIAGTYMNIPLAHIQAGDKSGHVDDLARMAIAKMAHIHLASCDDSAERLRHLGEQEFRIFNVGAPQLDNIVGRDYSASHIMIDDAEYDLTEPYILLVQHPILVERNEARQQMAATAKACAASGLNVIWIYPNSDLGYQQIVEEINQWKNTAGLAILENVEREQYLMLLANATILVGNSSSGILEAPSFKIPVVNIGNRQRGRQQASNIFNCGYLEDEISAAIKRCLNSESIREACAQAINPYGDGQSSERICEVLRDIPIDQNLRDKETIY